MGNTRDRILSLRILALALTIALLIRLALHVDNLLQSTLFESPTISAGLTLFRCLNVRNKVNIHLEILVRACVPFICDLLADIVILWVFSHLNLQDLSIDDIGRLLLHIGNLAS